MTHKSNKPGALQATLGLEDRWSVDGGEVGRTFATHSVDFPVSRFESGWLGCSNDDVLQVAPRQIRTENKQKNRDTGFKFVVSGGGNFTSSF